MPDNGFQMTALARRGPELDYPPGSLIKRGQAQVRTRPRKRELEPYLPQTFVYSAWARKFKVPSQLFSVTRTFQLPTAPESDAFDDVNLASSLLTANLFGRATNNLLAAKRLREAHAQLDHEMKRVGQLQRCLLPAKLKCICLQAVLVLE